MAREIKYNNLLSISVLLQKIIQKRQDRFISRDLVPLFYKTVPFIIKYHILYWDTIILDGFDHLIRFDLKYTGIIGALQDKDRLNDIIRMKRGDIE